MPLSPSARLSPRELLCKRRLQAGEHVPVEQIIAAVPEIVAEDESLACFMSELTVVPFAASPPPLG